VLLCTTNNNSHSNSSSVEPKDVCGVWVVSKTVLFLLRFQSNPTSLHTIPPSLSPSSRCVLSLPKCLNLSVVVSISHRCSTIDNGLLFLKDSSCLHRQTQLFTATVTAAGSVCQTQHAHNTSRLASHSVVQRYSQRTPSIRARHLYWRMWRSLDGPADTATERREAARIHPTNDRHCHTPQ
jgi:hypothetical protein